MISGHNAAAIRNNAGAAVIEADDVFNRTAWSFDVADNIRKVVFSHSAFRNGVGCFSDFDCVCCVGHWFGPFSYEACCLVDTCMVQHTSTNCSGIMVQIELFCNILRHTSKMYDAEGTKNGHCS